MDQPDYPLLPIVWFLDADDLLKRDCTSMCLRLIVEAVARWEKDGKKTLEDLRAEINDILEKKCP